MNLTKKKYLTQLCLSASLLLLSSEALAKKITFNCPVAKTQANSAGFDRVVKWESKGMRDFNFTLDTETSELTTISDDSYSIVSDSEQKCDLGDSQLKCKFDDGGDEPTKLVLNRSTLKLSIDHYYLGKIFKKYRGRCSIATNAF